MQQSILSSKPKVVPKFKPICVEIKDPSKKWTRTRFPTPNGELLFHRDEPVEQISCRPAQLPPPKPISRVHDILRQCRETYPDVQSTRKLLNRWCNIERKCELTSQLIKSIIFLDDDLATEALTQLRAPKDRLRRVSSSSGSIKGNSVIISVKHSNERNKQLSTSSALLDSGATGVGYINSSYVEKHNLHCRTLPVPIPVYNADNTLNKDGAITRTCTLTVHVGDHEEVIVFKVTDTGVVDFILGFGWLQRHNPIVCWRSGRICMTRCPTTCILHAPSDVPKKDPDIRRLSCICGPDSDEADDGILDLDPEQEWADILADELRVRDESLLCVDLREMAKAEMLALPDPRITDFLRVQKENASLPDKFIREFAPVFDKAAFDQLPPRRVWDHAIELKPDARPIKSKIYPLSKSEQGELDKFLEEHLASGRIRPSKSEYASPFFFVKKKDGSLRPVQDYRRLNEMTIKNRYPLPLVSDLMDKLKGAQYFTKLDVRWGYNNVRMKEGDEHKAAFLTNRGLFEPLVMFFGLTNSPATFQAMMNENFKDLIAAGHVVIYMDDILIFTDDIPTHELITRQVLAILQKENLYLKPEKCVFMATEVEYLGVIISHGCIRMDQKKIDAVTSWPTPRNKKDVQQFLGFVNFYRRFVKNFAKLAVPLNRLCGSTSWNWTDIEQKAFSDLRDAVAHGPVLALPLDDAPFRLEADSSGFATGAVLTQLQSDVWRPVAFFSKSLSAVERNYEIHDRELLSIMRALAEWRHYIHGTQFEVHSDHKNLLYFMTSQKLNRRQARWSLELAEFDFKLVHKPGTSMVIADALSRRPDYDTGTSDNVDVTLLRPEHIRRIAAEYDENVLVTTIMSHSHQIVEAAARYKNMAGWKLDNGLLTYYERIYVPDVDGLRSKIIRESHDTPSCGHPGRNKTTEIVQRDFWWPSVTKDVHAYVDGCDTCQRTKPLRGKPFGLLTPNDVPETFWDTISCDFITDLPRSRGYDSIMVCVDRLSKMVRLIPCNKTISAEAAARKYRDHVWKDFGLPSRIISDRGPQFVAAFMRALNKLLGITENFSTARRPQTDGQTERANQEIEIFLRAFVNTRQSDWADWIACAEFALNNKINSSTGYSPFFLNYGRHPRRSLMPVRATPSGVPRADTFARQMAALTSECSAALELASSSMKRSYDKHHQPAHVLKTGDLVLLDTNGISTNRPCRKLSDKRLGPFEVVDTVGLQSYRLSLPPSWKIHDVFHVSKLTPFRKPHFMNQSYSISAPELVEPAPTIREVLNHKRTRSGSRFLVTLDEQETIDATWLPDSVLSSFCDTNEALATYKSSFELD